MTTLLLLLCENLKRPSYILYLIMNAFRQKGNKTYEVYIVPSLHLESWKWYLVMQSEDHFDIEPDNL